jgi:hypothetical protein
MTFTTNRAILRPGGTASCRCLYLPCSVLQRYTEPDLMIAWCAVPQVYEMALPQPTWLHMDRTYL